jgi:hypothetical protein
MGGINMKKLTVYYEDYQDKAGQTFIKSTVFHCNTLLEASDMLIQIAKEGIRIPNNSSTVTFILPSSIKKAVLTD